MARITEPVHDHAKRSGCLSAPWAVFGLLVAVGVGLYALPEAWAVMVASGDVLTFLANCGLALIFMGFCSAPAVLYVIDALSKERFANECDKHTVEIDGEFHLDRNGGRVPGRLYVIDHGRGEVRAEWFDRKGRFHKTLVEKMSASELMQDDLIAHHGGLGKIDMRQEF